MRKIKYPSLILLFAVGILSVTAIVIILTHRDQRLRPHPSDLPLTDATQTLMETGGEIIGEFVAEKYSGKQVTIVVSPRSPEKALPAPEQGMLNGLLRTAGKMCDLRTLPLSPTAESAGALWQPGSVYDAAFDAAAESAAIVCLAGLPERLSAMRFWWSDNPPSVIIANAQVTQLENLVKTGKIRALLAHRPWLPGEPPQTGRRNWLLITTDTIDEITAVYTALFTKE